MSVAHFGVVFFNYCVIYLRCFHIMGAYYFWPHYYQIMVVFLNLFPNRSVEDIAIFAQKNLDTSSLDFFCCWHLSLDFSLKKKFSGTYSFSIHGPPLDCICSGKTFYFLHLSICIQLNTSVFFLVLVYSMIAKKNNLCPWILQTIPETSYACLFFCLNPKNRTSLMSCSSYLHGNTSIYRYVYICDTKLLVSVLEPFLVHYHISSHDHDHSWLPELPFLVMLLILSTSGQLHSWWYFNKALNFSSTIIMGLSHYTVGCSFWSSF